MSTGAAPFSVPQPEPLSQVARVVNIFVAPTKTFTDIRRSASWWLPLVLVAVISTGFFMLAIQKIGPDALAQGQLRMMPKVASRIDQLPPDQKQQAMQSMMNQTKRTPYTAAIFQFIMLLIVAAVLLGTFNFGVGAELKYKQSLAVVMYTSLVGTLKFIIAAIVLLVGVNPEGYTLQNPLASNLSVLFDPTQNAFLYWFGISLDVFMIWTLILAGIGFSIVSPKLKRSTALIIVFGWYLLFALGGAGLASLFMA